MMVIGEEIGELDGMFMKVGVFYEIEVEEVVKFFLSMLELLMIVVIGGIVVLILMFMYLFMFVVFENF